MAIEEFIARKKNLDGSTGTSKATIENHAVTYENSGTPSPFEQDISELQDSCFNYIEVSTGSQIKWTKFLTFTKTTDTTFVFETAKDNCLNEYKARITNGGNADIVLTFAGVTNILCNDDNCTILNNTLTLPTGVTIEISVLGGNMVAINFEA